MRKALLLVIILLNVHLAQSQDVNPILEKIDFGQDTMKAVFDWIAENVSYDVARAKAIQNGEVSYRFKDFDGYREMKRDRLEKVMKKNKGVCEDYSTLFDAMVQELGYRSYVIEGYTKDERGKLNSSIGHTWNAIHYKGKWRLYDATWAAGYVENDSKFIKRYNAKWYDIDPEAIIKTHMPFDPIWQLTDSPIGFKTFERGIDGDLDEMDYESLIDDFLMADWKAQMEFQVERSKDCGVGMRLVRNWQNGIEGKLKYYDVLSQPDLINKTMEENVEAVGLYNEYVAAKNKRFKKKKWTYSYTKQTLMSVRSQMESSIEVYKNVNVDDMRLQSTINKSILHAEKLIKTVDKELEFVEENLAH